MKKLLLISFMLFTCLGTFAQGVWVPQSTGSTDVSTGVNDVVVVDTSTVWITCYDGSGGGNNRRDYSRTNDGGATWTPGVVPTSSVWAWAHFAAVSDSIAWAVFFNNNIPTPGQGQIWHTTDAGTNWTQQAAGIVFSTPNESFPNVIHFFDANNGVVIGDPVSGEFEIYTTVDGGANWVPVAGANIPDPLTGEAGWTSHIDYRGDTVWFDTNNGRVYRSVDRGYNWTVSDPGLPLIVPGTIEMCFYGNGSTGIARLHTDPSTNDIVETTDGGLTWSAPFQSTGSFFGADVKSVPGTASMLVSTGIAAANTGTSYSTDGGHNWTLVESGTQRGTLGIADSLTMWCGGFTTSPTEGGIFKWTILQPVACNDPSVTPGIITASDSAICGGDTAIISATGNVPPFNGQNSGFTVVFSSAPITPGAGVNPLADPSFIPTTIQVFDYPAPSTVNITLINDGSLVDGANLPYGVYYFTPVVFANATPLNTPVNFLQDLTLDDITPCVFTGTSVPVNVKDPNGADCTGISVPEISNNLLNVTASVKDMTLVVRINSVSGGKVNIHVTDVTGRVVKTASSFVSTGVNHELVNVADLAAGTYVVKAEVNGNVATSKVVKN